MNNRTLTDWLEYAESAHPKGIDMGLERVRRVADRMGLLEQTNTRYVIVAGTNGKGSTTVAIETLLGEMGITVGATLSPHVHRFNERVRIAGNELDDVALCEAFAAVEAARCGRVSGEREDIPLTYFEFATLVALEAFRRAGVDISVLEVGLGGRLDAFNIIDAEVAVVTSIGLDHQAFLGDDIEQIGREKAGVFRSGQTVVLGNVSQSVHAEAARLNCLTLAAGEAFDAPEAAASWDYHSERVSFSALPRGQLAPANWALALTAVMHFQTPERRQLEAAIARAVLPGRLEQWHVRDQLVVLDVAHNPAGAAFLSAQLERVFPGKRFTGILGMLRDKDPAGVIAELASVSSWVVAPTLGVRSLDAAALATQLAGSPAGVGVSVRVSGDWPSALQLALSSCQEGDGILAIGSFSVVEQARNWLLKSPDAMTQRVNHDSDG